MTEIHRSGVRQVCLSHLASRERFGSTHRRLTGRGLQVTKSLYIFWCLGGIATPVSPAGTKRKKPCECVVLLGGRRRSLSPSVHLSVCLPVSRRCAKQLVQSGGRMPLLASAGVCVALVVRTGVSCGLSLFWLARPSRRSGVDQRPATATCTEWSQTARSKQDRSRRAAAELREVPRGYQTIWASVVDHQRTETTLNGTRRLCQCGYWI